MSSDQNDRLMRAYARLRALKENLPTYRYVEEIYVEQYHEGLHLLKESGFDVTEFSVPSVHLMHLSMGSGRQSKSQYIDRPLLLSKLDAVLTYFELATQRPPAIIGFHAPLPKGMRQVE